MESIETLSDLLHKYGWFLDLVERGTKHKRFAYAKRRKGRKVLTRYLKAESRLSRLTVQEVLTKIGVLPIAQNSPDDQSGEMQPTNPTISKIEAGSLL